MSKTHKMKKAKVMYVVRRNGRIAIKQKFESYQKALQAARKRIRKLPQWRNRSVTVNAVGNMGESNPTISAFGFRITRVK